MLRPFTGRHSWAIVWGRSTILPFMTLPHFMLRICAPNDTNGNPRRCWVTFNADGLPLAVYNEGYNGTRAIPDPEVRALALIAPQVNVQASEYKAWLAAADR